MQGRALTATPIFRNREESERSASSARGSWTLPTSSPHLLVTPNRGILRYAVAADDGAREDGGADG